MPSTICKTTAGTVQTMAAWADGDEAAAAAADIVLNSSIRDIMVPDYIRDTGAIDFTQAKVDINTGRLQLSRAEMFLVYLADNISYGPAGVHLLDLRMLWSLDDRNVMAVIDAITRHLAHTDVAAVGA